MNNNKEWEKEFEERFNRGSYYSFEDGKPEPLLAFITEQIQEAREETVEYIKRHAKQ